MPVLTRGRPDVNGRHRPVPAAAGASAPAQRLPRSRWRQPRLVLGLLLVAAAVVLGSRVLSALDDTVLVWQVDSAVRAGHPVDSLQVSPVSVRFTETSTQAAYLSVDQPLPAGTVVARDLAPGQLLSVSDLRTAGDVSAGQLPIDVPAGSVPADLTAGDRVDVWVVPEAAAVTATNRPADEPGAVRVLADVRVAAVAAPQAATGDRRQLLVDLPRRAADRLDVVLGRLSTGPPVAVRVPAQGR